MRTLYYYGQGTKEQWARIRQAKGEIGFPFQVQPSSDAVALERVLAFEAPDVLCDYALVTEATTVEGYKALLRWLFGGDDPRPTTIVSTLSRLLGGPVKEVPQSQLAREADAEQRDHARKNLSTIFGLERKPWEVEEKPKGGPNMKGNVNMDLLEEILGD